MSDADEKETGAKPLYAVWLTEEEAMRVLQICEEQQILRSVWNKIKASAFTKRPTDRVRTFIRETEQTPRPEPIQLNNPTSEPAMKSILLDRAREIQGM